MLIDAKANIQARNNETGWVPIHDAARYGNLDAIKQLLKNNAPHMARTAYGELPIDFARLHEHNQVAEYLGEISLYFIIYLFFSNFFVFYFFEDFE